MSEKTKNKPLSRQQELMRVFDFNEDDLKANQNGRLTSYQQKHIPRRERYRNNGSYYIAAITGFVALVFYIAIRRDTDLSTADVWQISLFSVCLPGFISVGSILWALHKWSWLVIEPRYGKLHTVGGIAVVDLGKEGQDEGTVTINNVKLQASRECLLRIKHLEPHIIYYLPKTKVIVSIEVVDAV